MPGRIGGTRRYTVGVWVGRPDGTPLPGQYGAVTALPLMFEVIDSLPRMRSDGVPAPPPGNVAEVEICWPLGLPPEADAPGLCQRRMKSWTLDGAIPPTFPERDARLWNAGRERFEVDAQTGLRLSAECARTHEPRSVEIARWPALVSPWLSAQVRKESRLPPLSPDCIADGRESSAELRIEGLNDRATIARAPGSAHGAQIAGACVGNGHSGAMAAGWEMDRPDERRAEFPARLRGSGRTYTDGPRRQRRMDASWLPRAPLRIAVGAT